MGRHRNPRYRPELIYCFSVIALPPPVHAAYHAPIATAIGDVYRATTEAAVHAASTVSVPFYSQFTDISASSWQKVGCGITSLTMVIDYYVPDAVSVETLLARGIDSGAYDVRAGWKHAGLITLASKYGLGGSSYDLTGSSRSEAFTKMKIELAKGPVIASVHYKMDAKNPIPHMVVLERVSGDTIFYNDPASKTGEKKITVSEFLSAWKQKYIVIRPVAGIAKKMPIS